MNNEEQKPHREAFCPSKTGKLDLVQVRADIEKKNGPEFWRSLEELAGTTEFQEMMHREFPKGASEWLEVEFHSDADAAHVASLAREAWAAAKASV